MGRSIRCCANGALLKLNAADAVSVPPGSSLSTDEAGFQKPPAPDISQSLHPSLNIDGKGLTRIISLIGAAVKPKFSIQFVANLIWLVRTKYVRLLSRD